MKDSGGGKGEVRDTSFKLVSRARVSEGEAEVRGRGLGLGLRL